MGEGRHITCEDATRMLRSVDHSVDFPHKHDATRRATDKINTHNTKQTSAQITGRGDEGDKRGRRKNRCPPSPDEGGWGCVWGVRMDDNRTLTD